MQKRLLLVCFLLLLVGCTKIQENNNYIESIKICLNEKSNTNNVSAGYKYYIPKGVKKIKDYDYNQVFLIEDQYIYLYVDIISYLYKKDLIIEKENNIYYYEKLNFNGKKGYIKIEEKENSKYFLSILYNYSKIEGYVSKEKLSKIITMSSIILNSIEYNDTVIEKILEGDLGKFSEFTYELKKPEDASSNFSQYLEEYVQKEESEQLPDE